MNKQNTLELLDKLDKVLDSMNTKEIIDQVILSKALNFFTDDTDPILSTVSFTISIFNHNNEFIYWDNFTNDQDSNILYRYHYFDNKGLRVA
ncbi:hypothetical protein [Treponema sp. OMZ 857]|uniref:hypothetical protein n=1 Tax=Treponema sp. OMZ 857 TaxID=1643513 RepID=UPI0020A3756B|nr:hypothetical protein [Treponema sp. OMZ 857]UTC44872.1 hypothetical protein E4N66_12700 [Treponema sp. OMZ 857]